jgi:hypothetical protein
MYSPFFDIYLLNKVTLQLWVRKIEATTSRSESVANLGTMALQQTPADK